MQPASMQRALYTALVSLRHAGLGRAMSGSLGNGSAHSPRGRSGAGVNAMDIDEMVVDLMPYVNTSSFVVGAQEPPALRPAAPKELCLTAP